MKASKFSDAQKAFILKQGGEGMPVAEICRKGGSARRRTSMGRRSTTGRSATPDGPWRRSERDGQAPRPLARPIPSTKAEFGRRRSVGRGAMQVMAAGPSRTLERQILNAV